MEEGGEDSEEGESQVSGDGKEESSAGVGKRQEAERRRPSDARVKPERSVVDDARALEWAGGARAWRAAI